MSESNYASVLKCIIIGIDQYSDTSLSPLLSPEKDAINLAGALQNKNSFAVPLQNTLLLTQLSVKESITKDLLLQKIQPFLQTLGEQDILFVYFAGHGEKDDKEFYLCLSDTVTGNLFETSWRGSEIDQLFGNLRIKGLFFVIDCCKSAGFAEHAPTIFTKSSGSDFRILLSSAKEDEYSWELPQAGGTLFSNHLIKVINGETTIGDNLGLIFFTDLFEHLQTKVEEDLESLNSSLEKQHPVFAGTYSRNPVLFAKHNLSVEQVNQKIKRYSREYVTRKIKRTVFSILIASIFIAGVTYTTLDNLQYVSVNKNGVLEIYKGHPTLNIFGFPKLIWTTALPLTGTKPDSKLRYNDFVISGIGKSVIPDLKAEMNSVYQALIDIYEKKDPEAHKKLKEFISDNLEVDSMQNDVILATLIFTRLANPEDSTLFKKIANLKRIEAKKSAIEFFAHDFDHQTKLIKTILHEQPAELTNVLLKKLQTLDTPSDSLLPFISGISEDRNILSQQPSTTISNLMLTCSIKSYNLPDKTILNLIFNTHNSEDLDDISMYVKIRGRSESIRNSLKIKLVKFTNALKNHNYNFMTDINHALSVLSKISSSDCLPEYKILFNSPMDYFKEDAAAAILNSCPDVILPLDKPEVILEAAKYNKLDADTLIGRLNTSKDEDALIALINAAKYFNSPKVDNTIFQFLTHTNSYIVKLAIDILTEKKYPFGKAGFLLLQNEGEVVSGAIKWLFTQKPNDAVQIIMQRINDPKIHEEILAEIFSNYKINNTHRNSLFALLNGDQFDRGRASMILSLSGTDKDAIKMLTHQDITIRSAATKYLMLNTNIILIDSQLKKNQLFPDFTSEAVADALIKLKDLRVIQQKADKRYISWIANLVNKTSIDDHSIQVYVTQDKKWIDQQSP